MKRRFKEYIKLHNAKVLKLNENAEVPSTVPDKHHDQSSIEIDVDKEKSIAENTQTQGKFFFLKVNIAEIY